MSPPSTLALAALPLTVLLVAIPSGAVDGNERFRDASSTFLAGYWQRHPVSATGAGVHQYDGAFADLTPAGRDELVAWLRGQRAAIAGIPDRGLDQRNHYDRLLLLDQVDGELFYLTELRSDRTNPLRYNREIGDGIYTLIAREYAPADQRLRAALARVRRIPDVLAAARASLTHPPRLYTETVIKQNQGTIALLEGDLAGAADRAHAAGAITPALRDSLRDATVAAVASLREYGTWLETDLLPRSTGDFRMSPELYARKLQYDLPTDRTPAELLARAKAEYGRVRRQMLEVALPLHARFFSAHAHGTLAAGATKAPSKVPNEDLQAVVREVLDRLADDHPDADSLLDVYTRTVRGLEDFVRARRLMDMTGDPLEVIWTPEYARGVAMAGLDSPGPLEPHEKAFFQVSPVTKDTPVGEARSFLREYNDHMLQILCIHEAVPGHYVQGAHAHRYPSVVASVFGSGAFVEGWAVYTERMMLDEGYGNGDPALRLQQLKFWLRTVCNTILDIRFHTMGMTEDEARKLLKDGAFQESYEVEGKIRRATLTSAQLCCYFTGAAEIRDLRAEYARRRGSAFRLGEFHNRLLAHGDMPVRYLREILLSEASAGASHPAGGR